jgi:NAD(P)-dependent dehydrogenase (short-subunit alcohol dehydrogenase family)
VGAVPASRAVIITGGTGGLGSAVTEEFLEAGWRVTVPWFKRHEADGLLARPAVSAAGDRVTLVEADLFDADSVGQVVAEAAAHANEAPLAAVVNLVGGYAIGGRVHETPVEEFEGQLRTNLRAAYLVCAAALPALLKRGDGAIVCVSSRAAKRPFSGAAGYIASKAAVLAFVEALAAEYTGDGIRTNAIIPSVIDTPANRAGQPDADHSRWVKPTEIAKVIRFLCSEESSPVSGAQIPVYGRA